MVPRAVERIEGGLRIALEGGVGLGHLGVAETIGGAVTRFAVGPGRGARAFEVLLRQFDAADLERIEPRVVGLARVDRLGFRIDRLGGLRIRSVLREFENVIAAGQRLRVNVTRGRQRQRHTQREHSGARRACALADHDTHEQAHDREQHEPLEALAAHHAPLAVEVVAHQVTDVLVVDRLEVERTEARRHVDAVGEQRHLTQGVAVEARGHDIAVGVAQQGAGAGFGIGDRDLATRFRTEADRHDADPAQRGLPGRLEGKGVVILAIGDQDQYARDVPARAKAERRLADRLFESRAPPPHAVRPQGIEHQAEEAEVGGHGSEHTGAPREGDQAHLISLEIFEQIADLALGALQSVRRDVLGEHRARDVDRHHQLGARAGRLDVFEAPLRSHQRHHRKGRRQHDEGIARVALPRARALHQTRLQGRRHHPLEAPGRATLEEIERERKERDAPQCMGPLRIGEAEVAHGYLRNTLLESSAASPMQPSDANTHPSKCSVYCR